ncbi:MAG: hypothetical protein ACYC8V_09335 [Caulobacteraceae bacterium]
MNRILVMAILALGLSACGAVRGDYDLPQGDANYDALKAAVEACKAQGGRVQLRAGYDSRVLSNYQCKFGKAGS